MVGLAVTAGPPDIGEGHIVLLPFNYSAVVQGTWAMVNTNAWGFNSFSNSSNATADELNFIAYLAAGTYVLVVNHRTDTNMGILKIYIDGVLADTIDAYAAAPTAEVYTRTTGITISSSGLKTIRFKVDGKNAASSDYYATFNAISLYRSA